MNEDSSKAPAEPFVMLTRELLASASWRCSGINIRRLIDFLMIEHMAHGGKENGKLKAPYEQLEAFGIGARYVADTIRKAEEAGLVDCYRGGRRVATTYALTWLPLDDGMPATNRWRTYQNPTLRPLPSRKVRNLPAKGKVGLPVDGKVDVAQNDESALQREGRLADILPTEGKVLSIRMSAMSAKFSLPAPPERAILPHNVRV